MGQTEKTELFEHIYKIFEIAFKPIIFILSSFSFEIPILSSCFVISSTSIQPSQRSFLCCLDIHSDLWDWASGRKSHDSI